MASRWVVHAAQWRSASLWGGGEASTAIKDQRYNGNGEQRVLK